MLLQPGWLSKNLSIMTATVHRTSFKSSLTEMYERGFYFKMNAFKNKPFIGKKIMSVMSAAIVGLSTLGGLKLTSVDAMAATSTGVYYDAGTFTIGGDYKMSNVKSSLSDPESVNGTKITLPGSANVTGTALSLVDTTVAFDSTKNSDYTYIAKGEVHNGTLQWSVKAWPTGQGVTAFSSATASSVESNWNTWYNAAEPKFSSEISWGTSTSPWITITSTPFKNASSVNDDEGYFDLSIYKPHSTSFMSDDDGDMSGMAANEDDTLGLLDASGKSIYLRTYTDSSASMKDVRLYYYDGGERIYYDSQESTKKFTDLIRTNETSGVRVTTTPTFATPYNIRQAWLWSLPTAVEDTEKNYARKDITGLRLEGMDATVSYKPSTIPTSAYSGGGSGQPHVLETNKINNGANLPTTSSWQQIYTVKNFGVNNDTASPISANLSDHKVAYSEATDDLMVNHSDELCKIVINSTGKATTKTGAYAEICNTRVAMKVDVNARWRYSTDLPRMAGTVNTSVVILTNASNKSIATDSVNGTHTMSYSANATIVDRVPYTGLIIGNSYTVESRVYDLKTAKEVYKSDPLTFKADNSGYVNVEIKNVNSVANSGKTFYVLATIYEGSKTEKIVCSYTDGTDPDTQVVFPTVSTVLTANNRTSKTVSAASGITLIDNVTYTGLTPGQPYEITGYILHKEQTTGDLDQPIIIGSEGSSVANDIKIVAHKTITFTPTTANGTVTVQFDNVKTSDLMDQHLVAVETIVDGPSKAVVGKHADINDANQTVAVKSSNDVYTGGNDMTTTFALTAGICAIAAIGFGVVMFIRKRRTNK